MIEIFGRAEGCSWCDRAKVAAESYGRKYIFLDISDPSNKTKMLERLPEAKTVPQIFEHGRHIGGYSEFAMELENTSGGYGDGL